MRIELKTFVAATLAVGLLAACGERAEEKAATAPTAEQPSTDSAQTENAPGTTTTFEESSPEPQSPAQ